MKSPRTHKLKHENIAGEECRCNHCGIIHECTFRFDFYTLSFKEYKESEPMPLYCETCMWIENSLHEKNNK
jgi:hypothetical protein